MNDVSQKGELATFKAFFFQPVSYASLVYQNGRMAARIRKMLMINARIKQPTNCKLEKIKNMKLVKLRNCDKKEQIINFKT